MTWTHPDIPKRFRHVHREWADLAWSERNQLRRSLHARRDYGTLFLLECWEEYHTANTSPIRMGGWR